MTLMAFTCMALLRWQSDTEMAKYKAAGGIIQWVDRTEGHLLIRRYEEPGKDVALSAMPPLLEVTTLTLYGRGFSDSDVKTISSWTHLRAVHVVYCTTVTDTGIQALARCNQLRFLSVWDTSFKGECLGSFAKLTDLRKLYIQNCSIGDKRISTLKSWKRLEKLMLYNVGITEEMAVQLEKSLPDCEVEARP